MTSPHGGLPSRLAPRHAAPQAAGPVRFDPATDPRRPLRLELAGLRHQVVGVTGCIIAGVDGLLILHDSRSAGEPHDVAAMAAAAHGISRTCGGALAQGPFQEVTIRNRQGCLAVYGIGDLALLAVVGDGTVNIARLHLEARPVLARLATMLDVTQL
ncbi:roadblock/LC7 domain-containing protein [Actinoplanes xinjiangensis]|uniref:roadblock/LC7 domain-containing protein n=1 Tax=Actinoplanes xinjiangensis TaxID=512350 RepID=UPI003414F707